MNKGVHVMSWVAPEVKERFASLARAQGLSESAYLRQMIHSLVRTSGGMPEQAASVAAALPKDLRIAIRLRPEDHRLLRERASIRAMPTSAYVAVLVRSHLYRVAPLPNAELEALKAAIAELSAMGRNLNQIAHAINRGQYRGGPTLGDLQGILRALTVLRDHIKALILRNAESWEVGHDKAAH